LHGLTHIDLFAGIGGFALAAKWAGFRTIAFCEIDPFCREVLKARFGAVADTGNAQTPRQRGNGGEILSITESMGFDRNYPLLIPDIRTFDGTQFRGATLLTGGVPCQPASIAGKRKGTADDRWLWPEAIRVLAEVKPTWAIFENPPGILSLERGVVFEDLLSQMEGEGYEVRPVIIPACAVNAPHRRDRVWIIGHASELGLPGVNGRGSRKKSADGHIKAEHPENDASLNELSSGDSGGPPANSKPAPSRPRNPTGESDSDAPDASSQRLSGDVQRKLKGVSSKIRSPERGQPSRGTTENEQWEEPWFEVATRLCRVDARVSSRVDRLKALGNAIVPQVAYQIIKTIAEIEREGLT
jgi:DNA (cytosine-5)-methyltransferase 1